MRTLKAQRDPELPPLPKSQILVTKAWSDGFEGFNRHLISHLLWSRETEHPKPLTQEEITDQLAWVGWDDEGGGYEMSFDYYFEFDKSMTPADLRTIAEALAADPMNVKFAPPNTPRPEKARNYLNRHGLF